MSSVDEMVARVPSGTFARDPDEYKNLYGFYGPFYNTARLDGYVKILGQTVYTWPTAKWKVSGLVRNQTRQTVHIKSISATLRGPHGEDLGTVTTSVPISNLRPGEPGPFVIESTLAQSAVETVEWNVDFETSQGKPRLLIFDIFDDGGSREGVLYDLFVTVRSEDATATRKVKVVTAWLDDRDRVLYVDSLKVYPSNNPEAWREWVDLIPNASNDFIYRTEDPSIVSLLIKARRVLWGDVE